MTNMKTESKVTIFAGKGGVGKTTSAAATSMHYADSGKRTLCISTDPTPSLSHIFDVKGDIKPLQVKPRLYFSELGTDEVTEMWDRKFGQEVYRVFSAFVDIGYAEFTEFMVSILPGLKDEFVVDYIRDLRLKNEYDAIVWDTAPLGQTLALLKTPAMLTKHLRMAPRIYSRLKPAAHSRESIMDIIKSWDCLSAANMDFLQNEVDFTLVTIPEALAVEQLEPVSLELDKYGIKIQRLIINNVIEPSGSHFLSVRAERQKKYLETIHRRFASIPVVELPLVSYEIRGVENLARISRIIFRHSH